MNVKRLESTALNYWVAKSAGLKLTPSRLEQSEQHDPESGFWHPRTYQPATDWSQGGPIVSNEWFGIEDILVGWFGPEWTQVNAITESPLKWFMRAYVASQFGDEVEDNHVAEPLATAR
jgi:hypothetical protein